MTAYAIEGGALRATLAEGGATGLAEPEKLAGFAATPRRQKWSCSSITGCTSKSISIALTDRQGPIRPASPTSSLKSAITTIQDCEDSVAAVDAEDKVWSIATGSG